MKGYGQFCPVAKASEIVAERWTPLVLRELVLGGRRFSELRRGLPQMSPSLLSKRLKTLEDEGIVEHANDDDGASYRLTEAGRELAPVIQQLGVWGHRWTRAKLRPTDLDAGLLMWNIRNEMVAETFPGDQRVCVCFELVDAPANKRRWWMVIGEGEVDLCLRPPGYDVDLEVSSTLRTMTDVWMGYLDLGAALRDELILLTGSRPLERSFTTWFRLHPIARGELPGATPA